MYRLIISLILFFCSSIAISAQEAPFEGTIRMFNSMNLSSSDGIVNKTIAETKGDKLSKAIAKKIVKKSMKKTDKYLQASNGDYEVWFKVKGNKVAFYNTQTKEISICDGDKEEITAVYPLLKAAIKYKASEWPARNLTPKTEDIEGENENILGYDCTKHIQTIELGGITSTTEMWCSTALNIPEFYFSIFKSPGFPLKTHYKMDGPMETEVYAVATEIVRESIPDDVFILPADCEIVSSMEFTKRMKKAAKKMEDKPVQVGVTIPDTFWDF